MFIKPSKRKDVDPVYEKMPTDKSRIFGYIIITFLVFWSFYYYWLFHHLSAPQKKMQIVSEMSILDVFFGKQESVKVNTRVCKDVPLQQRFDCHPEEGASPDKCYSRGCCWKSISQEEIQSFITRKNRVKGHLNLPYCYYPKDYVGYYVTGQTIAERNVSLDLKRNSTSHYPYDVKELKMQLIYETSERIRIKIFDPVIERWQPPIPEVPGPEKTLKKSRMYDIQINNIEGTFKILRTSSGTPVFDNMGTAPLIFADQFLQISTRLSSDYIYGLGQHIEGLALDTLWHQRVLWNLDQYPLPDRNLYGSHPFFLNMEPDGNAHGFLLVSSNALDAVIQPTPAVTFHVIGGILDMYVFMGPTPDDVIRQYTDVIGKPFLPPYWSLGYHQCRFGYGSLNRTKQIWQQTRDADIPFDTQWNDIDYMDKNNDFTYDKVKYEGLPEFVDELHKEGMHYIPIIDPGISASEEPGTYPPFDSGLRDGIFIRNESGQPFIGKVWNAKTTTWPDFTHPRSIFWWAKQIQSYHDLVKFDGAWIDMNEPSNFWSGQEDGCSFSKLDNPPYLPPVHGGKLSYHTVCMNAQHHLGSHYDVHNLYGFTETLATNIALKLATRKRPFVISRATFVGQGQFGGHWTGDVVSDWDNLWLSISDVLNFNMFGIPMVGADICGFNGNTTASLCLRWMQLGAFYPFARNHNTDDAIDQDPVSLGNDVVTAARQALNQRYKLLPFLYTLFFRASKTGLPVARPLFFQFPKDEETYTIDTQFMWGEALMIVPALDPDVSSVEAYLPKGNWYDWYLGNKVGSSHSHWDILDTPLDRVTLLVLGGHILTLQEPAQTTTQSRLNKFELLVALDENNYASGELYWDDGETLDAINNWKFTHVIFMAKNNSLSNLIDYKGYDSGIVMDSVRVYGVKENVTAVALNGIEINFEYDELLQVLHGHSFHVPLDEKFSMKWK